MGYITNTSYRPKINIYQDRKIRHIQKTPAVVVAASLLILYSCFKSSVHSRPALFSVRTCTRSPWEKIHSSAFKYAIRQLFQIVQAKAGRSGRRDKKVPQKMLRDMASPRCALRAALLDFSSALPSETCDEPRAASLL